ncbi:MAG: hypothetical protein AAGF07_05255 [Patescibacteria group bacterium]
MNKSTALAISSISGIVIFVAIILIFFGDQLQPEETSVNEPDTNSEVRVEPLSDNSETNQEKIDNETDQIYENGVYTSTGTYTSPAGSESIEVELSLNEDIISQVSITNLATNRVSIGYQEKFQEGISGRVVGKKLDEATVGKINGSSLTGDGFNEVVQSIQKEAKK